MRDPERLKIGGLELAIESSSGIGTTIACPTYNLCFDMGHAFPLALKQDNVFISHTHMDHCTDLWRHAAVRDLRGGKENTARYWAPNGYSKILREWLHLTEELEDAPVYGTVDPATVVTLPNRVEVRPFQVIHRISCVGYGVLQTTKRQTGLHTAVKLVYSGDTTLEGLAASPYVQDAEVLVTECTFIGESVSVEKAKQRGHIHLDELAPRLEEWNNGHIVLTHFSPRFSRGDIEKAVRKSLPRSVWERTIIA